MKILFLCNIVPTAVSAYFGEVVEVCGGWVVSLIERLKNEDLSIVIVFPYKTELNKLTIDNISYYSFVPKYKEPTKYDKLLEIKFSKILRNEHPDYVHIFGTEFPHSLAMTRAFNNPECTLCHIQGLISVISKHYTTGLSHDVCSFSTFRDFIRHDNIVQQQKKFHKRGRFEIEALRSVGHIMGRTSWDKECTYIINPNAKYHYVQEMMRTPFYEGQWSYNNCEKHSMFMSQGMYPIKGLHYALEALSLLHEQFKDVKLYVGGDNIFGNSSLLAKIKMSSYVKYIRKKIKKYKLEESVIFTGRLSANQMKQYYLKCNVFISPSVIENSPNSIAEALLLGVPVVASDVGGVSSIVTHNETAFLYPVEEPYMLAYYVGLLFENSELGMKMGKIAKERAIKTYNRDNILKQVISVYNHGRI